MNKQKLNPSNNTVKKKLHTVSSKPKIKKAGKIKMSTKITPYERKQLSGINEWKKKEPGVVSKSTSFILSPISNIISRVMPVKAIQGAIDLGTQAAKLLTDQNDLLRDSNTKKIEHLRSKSIKLSDKLANEVHNWAIGIAAAEGTVTGVAGIYGIVVDVPSLVVLSIRTINKIGLCYGYEVKTKEDEAFLLSVLSSASANTYKEKTEALLTLKVIQNVIAKQTWKKMAQTSATNKLSKEAAVIALKNLAKQLGVNITKRKALAAIPVVGGVIGGSINAWYIKEVGWAARRIFQERWLTENGKLNVKNKLIIKK